MSTTYMECYVEEGTTFSCAYTTVGIRPYLWVRADWIIDSELDVEDD